MKQDGIRSNRYRKYRSFFRMRFIAGLQYRAAAIGGIATQFVWGIMGLLMFKAFYEVSPEAFPMTFEALSSYIWLQQAFLALFMTWFLENEIFQTITEGGIAYELCRPIDIYDMWFFRSMANRLSKAVLRCLPILVFAAFLPFPYGISLPSSFKAGFWFLLTAFLGFLVVVAFCMLVYHDLFYILTDRSATRCSFPRGIFGGGCYSATISSRWSSAGSGAITFCLHAECTLAHLFRRFSRC